MLQSSFHPSSSFDPNIIPQKNGFVDTVVRCYNEHGALVIRPDDGKSAKNQRVGYRLIGVLAHDQCGSPFSINLIFLSMATRSR